jgi:ribonucleoside-diphosphate reductase alpha chain
MVGQVIKQGGKRRSANMGLLHYNHPDILRWIHVKDVEDLSSLNLNILKHTHPNIVEWIHTKNTSNNLSTFNLSVALTDEFFEKVDNDEQIVFINPRNGEPFPAYDPLIKSSLDSMPAKVLLNRIAKLMWKSGEPGVIFWSTMQNDNPAKGAVGVDGVNPCGESPLPHWGSCILGSVNLYNHLKDQNGAMVIDFDKIALTTITMTKFLNAVIDNNVYPLPQMREVALRVRQIGIGIMGFADMLGVMGVRYGSVDSMQLAYLIMSTIQNAATNQSKRLSFTHGPYPAWEHAEHKTVGIRNATLTSIAPTGSISFIASVSSGLEPFFKIAYMMNRDDKTPTFVVARSFMSDLKKHGLEGVLGEMVSNDYTPTQMIEKGLLPESFSHYVTANEVTPVEHVKMQAEFQKYVDLAISKTVNLPHDATVEDIENVIMSAYEQRCKGLTVFRDNCFRDAFLTEIACSSCGSTNVEHKEGCMTCSDCGTSLCSVG